MKIPIRKGVTFDIPEQVCVQKRYLQTVINKKYKNIVFLKKLILVKSIDHVSSYLHVSNKVVSARRER